MNDEAKASSPIDAAASTGTPAKAVRSSIDRAPRTIARVAAVQALFQMDLAGTGAVEVINEFKTSRFNVATDSNGAPEPVDMEYFDSLVQGVVRLQREIDPMIAERLAAGWRLGRLDRTLRAILRAGAFEIVKRHDVPAAVVINEYVDIAHAFFDGEEPKVVNGVLDRIARERPNYEDASSKLNTERDNG